MRKIGLRLYFTLSFFFFALFVVMVTAGLWFASDQLKHTAIYMNDSVESITAAQSILDHLEIHRRQALMRGIRVWAETELRRKGAEKDLQHSLQTMEAYVAGDEERGLVESANKSIAEYLALSHRLQEQGQLGSALYIGTAAKFEVAVADVTNVIRINEKQAQALEVVAMEQSASYKNWSLFLIVIIFTAVVLLLWLFHRLIYLPIMELRQVIETYSRTQTVPGNFSSTVTEVGEISFAFRSLALSLQRQREQRLLFISSVAHDLKNPLGAIQMSVDLLADRNNNPTNSAQLTAIVKRQVHQLLRLIEDLLDATRIESGNLDLKKSVHNVTSLLGDSVTLFNSVSENHELRMHAPTEELLLECDSVRLSQVFNNLLSNAIKYSPEGGEVKVELRKEGDSAVISIADKGIGIDPSEFDLIFEPFLRPSASRHQIPGVGLGLSTSRRIVEAHRGSIRVQSERGQGTVFIVTLPFLKSTKEERSGTALH